MTYSTYVLYALGAVSLLQLVALGILLRRRASGEVARLEARLAHFAEALALLTDTTQSGFTTVAAELERTDRRRAPSVSRAATARRIVTAAQAGRSIQDIAAVEEVSESEVGLQLGLAAELAPPPAPVLAKPRPRAVAHETPQRQRRGGQPVPQRRTLADAVREAPHPRTMPVAASA